MGLLHKLVPYAWRAGRESHATPLDPTHINAAESAEAAWVEENFVAGNGQLFTGETLEEIQTAAAAVLPAGTPYAYMLISGGVLLDIDGGTT